MGTRSIACSHPGRPGPCDLTGLVERSAPAVRTVPAGLSDPTTTTVDRRPGSARRTSHVDMIFGEAALASALRLRGAARDTYTGAADDPPEVIAAATIDARLGSSRELLSVETSPHEPATTGLLGRPVGRGFRAALQETVWEATGDHDPLHLLLDDLPVAALISGYATLYDSDGPEPGGQAPPGGAEGTPARLLQEDICSGWRHDGTMMVALRSGRGLPIPVGPVAPRIEESDPHGWHPMLDLPAKAMRRRRLIDVAGGEVLDVRAMFRDTHTGADGVETVLHEYTLTASVEPGSLRIVECQARPQSLPWPECPGATDSARRLVGLSLEELRAFVPREMRGTSTCTHLNDLLRSLADVAVLAAILARRRGD